MPIQAPSRAGVGDYIGRFTKSVPLARPEGRFPSAASACLFYYLCWNRGIMFEKPRAPPPWWGALARLPFEDNGEMIAGEETAVIQLVVANRKYERQRDVMSTFK